MNKYWLRILFTNINVLIILIFLLNFGAILVYQTVHYYRAQKEYNDTIISRMLRYNSPAYKNEGWEEKHQEEYFGLATQYEDFFVWRRLPFQGETINVDAKGLRKTFTHPMENKGSKKAVFLGGSAIWGEGSYDDATIPSYFSKLMQGEYNSINLGESGYNAFQEYVHLSTMIATGLKPDLIVSYDGGNDREGLFDIVEDVSTFREWQIREQMKDFSAKQNDGLKFSVLIKPISEFISRFFAESKTTSYDLNDENVEAVALTVLHSWKLIYGIAKQNEAEYVILLQPIQFLGNPKVDHLERNTNRAEAYKKLYAKIHELIKLPEFEVLSKNFYDLTDAFDLDEYIFIDFIHVAPKGNEIIAQRVVDIVNESFR